MELLRIFSDEAVAFEVMWGLVHLVEDLDYIPTLVELTPEMSNSAKSWLELLYRRILTTEPFKERLTEVLTSTSEQKTAAAKQLIKEVMHDL